MYLLIKYIKSFLWRGPERLSYIEDVWRLKVKTSGLLISVLFVSNWLSFLVCYFVKAFFVHDYY